MATLKEIVTNVKAVTKTPYTEEQLTGWLSDLEGKIALNVFLLSITEARQQELHWPQDQDKELLVGYPHDSLYELWLQAKIQFQDREFDDYDDTMRAYNAQYNDFCGWFARTYAPAQGCLQDPPYYLTAYGLAVMAGYQGTLKEWLASLAGRAGDRVELRYDQKQDALMWRITPAEGEEPEPGVDYNWQILISLEAIRGPIIEKTLTQAENARDLAQTAALNAHTSEENALMSADASEDSAVRAEAAAEAAAETARAKTQNVFATCTDPAAPAAETANNWYVPKTMPRPSGEVGMTADVFWLNGRENGLGYDVNLIWGEPGGADNETILSGISVVNKLAGGWSIKAEGTVRYQLETQSDRKRWMVVGGDIHQRQFTAHGDASAEVKEINTFIKYLPGMEIYVQMENGNTAPVMKFQGGAGEVLPVYGNGTGRTTGEIPIGYILHLINGGDHWQIINDRANLENYVTYDQLMTAEHTTLNVEFEDDGAGGYRTLYYNDNDINNHRNAGGLVQARYTAPDGQTYTYYYSTMESDRKPTFIRTYIDENGQVIQKLASVEHNKRVTLVTRTASNPPVDFNMEDLGFFRAPFNNGDKQVIPTIDPAAQKIMSGVITAMIAGRFAKMSVGPAVYLLNGISQNLGTICITGNSGEELITLTEDNMGTVSIQKRQVKADSDLSLGVTGAQVGQIVEVQEIGPDGKPTKWRAAEKPEALPASTAPDVGKFLRVNASGNAEWQTVPDAKGVGF